MRPDDKILLANHKTVKGESTIDPACRMTVDPASAAAMSFSSVSVIGNALRLRRVEKF
jgi:cation transport ATPase